jgi:hypothetical protein
MKWIRENGISMLLFATVMLIMLYGFQDAARSSQAERLRITEETLRHAVISCYALEGRYPPSVDYLQQKYGLQLDEKNYVVHYEVFAENIMPDITVMER